MNLTDLAPAPGAKKKKKREARGRAGYGGKTAGRGHNGQGQRAGASIRKQFEGGQTPLYRRLPKHQYISSPNATFYTIINLNQLNNEALEGINELTPEILLEKKVIKKLENGGLKVLGTGEIKKAVKITAHSFSGSAQEKIKKAGGSIELVGQN
ncbi:MAG: 50S ribosomal protein L15 [Candidatus Caenarcaniphilales bacterium]|nr:50S ribosomal protein L15 [Candidatus Caenarcaniphilales bacterium]